MSTQTHPHHHSPEAPHPAAVKKRLPALDVLRGIAILGTLLTNIWIFSSATVPVGADGAPLRPSETFAATLGQHVSTALNLVTDGKFIGLLTIMFGIGLEIQRQSAIRKGEKWPGRYPWRAGLLVLDGLLNYIFIFEFDVLMGYGLTGLVVAAVMATSPKAQKNWMGVGITLHLIVISVLSWGGGFNAPPPDAAERAEMDPATLARMQEQMAQFEGMSHDSYWGQVQERLIGFIGGRMEIPIMFTMGLGLFLVGAHLYRAGIFEERGAKLRRWVMGLSFGIGLPIDWYLRLANPDWAGAFPRYVTSSLVAFGVLALVAAIYVRKDSTGWFATPLSYVGRMALTCYISQNLISSIIFYDWGFGVSAKIQGDYFTFWTLAIYVGISAILVTFSWVWLRFLNRGPVEWVWHESYDWVCTQLDKRKARKQLAQSQQEAEPVTASA